ncbi:MAG: hypothetical protein E7813_08345 [Bradyrhizobium sp.]|uniref:HNH endonuclease n=1 Tax=Bradyrhizobium sp. TaxID=376 RepID=UPI00120C43F7|nr:hypothetical protein [Bradyrhizobium sp.]THD70426.1 MAG: hypothetical protein E7813_08345 [Bradyrhizobium sp.]
MIAEDVKHFVAYHNSDKFGRYRTSKGKADKKHTFWTAKSFKNETLLGQHIWAFEGIGSPKKYCLVAAGKITKIRKARGNAKARLVYFEVGPNNQPIDVTGLSWFKALLKQQQSFRNGLNRLGDRDVIRSLESLVASKKAKLGQKVRLNASSAILRDVSLRFSRLVPHRQANAVLQALGHSIDIANQADPTKWGVRINDRSIMLKVGFVEVLQIGKGWFHELIKNGHRVRNLKPDPTITFSKEPYTNAPDCDTCNFDTQNVARLYPRLSNAHEEAIRVAALSRRHTSTIKDHSQELVEFLSKTLGRRLPQPGYIEKISEPRFLQKKHLTVNDFEEGRVIQVLANRYERNPAARMRCIEYYGTNCFVCGLSLVDQYGPEISGLIHVHHLNPISKIGRRSSVDPIRDLRPVCPNCHAVIHWTEPHQSVKQVKEKLRKAAKR